MERFVDKIFNLARKDKIMIPEVNDGNYITIIQYPSLNTMNRLLALRVPAGLSVVAPIDPGNFKNNEENARTNSRKFHRL
jgi:hypothetical protein